MLIAQSNSLSTFQWLSTGAMILAGVLLFALTVIGLSMLYFRRNRQLLHLERMRAIEMGQPLAVPDDNKVQATAMHNTFWIAFWIGFGVPCATFWAAANAVNGEQLGMGIVIWTSAGVASTAAVICATVLMIRCQLGQTGDSGAGASVLNKSSMIR